MTEKDRAAEEQLKAMVVKLRGRATRVSVRTIAGGRKETVETLLTSPEARALLLAAQLIESVMYGNPDLMFALHDAPRLRAALENHLCEHDLADWIGCSMNHMEYCTVCQHADHGGEHALLVRAEKAEAELSALKSPHAVTEPRA